MNAKTKKQMKDDLRHLFDMKRRYENRIALISNYGKIDPAIDVAIQEVEIKIAALQSKMAA
jgi:hypothetical protein